MANQHRIRSHGSKWGPGKVHLRSGADTAECRPGEHIYAEPVDSTVPLTCKNCIKLNGGKA